MSNDQIFRLTTKDYTILEVMLDRRLGRDDPLVPILQRKLSAAIVTFREDIPANVVTLSSRVTYRVNDAPAETRIVTHDEMRGLVGSVLSITNPRGLALLGLAEGERMTFARADGSEETISAENVVYQPEASLLEKAKLGQVAEGGQATLQPAPGTVHGSGNILLRAAKTMFMTDSSGFDDPGPSAA
ncbi:GreA/GreB family elongation factor [Mesorhizobium comanense]|uniref:GreA/GreB family elongation factor n=1 Tax=Mesorhizobium comanense TaxID=2502215 RepID=UPI0010F79F3F|nr:GreA/GreB family elongation factor [Mesorhizobium comanense]